jgi:hypothetical protein
MNIDSSILKKEESNMAIKNARIGMLVDDWQLRTQLAQWFRQQGAIVHSAQGEKEWEQMREKLELDMVILDRPKRGVTTGGISLN